MLRGAYLIPLLFLFITGVYDPQRLQSPAQQTFRSPNDTFQFVYPRSYRLYTGSEAYEADQGSYIPVCQFVFVACVVYPTNEYAGTNFQGAAFQVREIEDKSTATECLTPRPGAASESGFSIAAKDPKRIIHGVRFLHGEFGGAATGHSIGTDLYRAFHQHTCYELSINLTEAAFGNFAPGTIKEFTTADEQRVHDNLAAILDSFRFLN